MRRFFRLVGLTRLIVGFAIIVVAFALRSNIGEGWTGLLVLLGASIGVAGFTSLLLYIAYYLILPAIFVFVIWISMEFWDGYSYLDSLRKNFGYVLAFWVSGVIGLPIALYYLNRSWFFMADKFSLNEAPSDTRHPELSAFGLVDITGDPYFAAATITEQGLILDRRNFAPVILDWRWVESIKPDVEGDARSPSAVLALRNNHNDYLTLSIPCSEELLKMDLSRGIENGSGQTEQK